MVEENKSTDGATNVAPEGHREADSIAPSQSEIGARKCKKCKKPYFSKPKNRVAFATLIAVGFYTGITALMWCNSNRQLAAVIESNKINREAFTSVQRAFIVVNGLEITRADGNNWNIKPIIKNSGNTPTKNMVYTAIFVQLLGEHGGRRNDVEMPNVPGDPATVFYALGASDEHRGLAVLGPQTVLPFSPGRQEISQNLLDRFKILGYPLIVGSGAILYYDVFPNTKRHITKYCFTATADGGTQGTCGYWNCADDECKADAEAYNKAVEAAYKAAKKPTDPGALAKVDFP